MPYHRLQLFCRGLSWVGEVDFMVEAGGGEVVGVAGGGEVAETLLVRIRGIEFLRGDKSVVKVEIVFFVFS